MPMRIPTQIPPTIFETFPRVSKQISPRVSVSGAAPPASQSRAIANNIPKPLPPSPEPFSPSPLTFANYRIDTTTLPTAADISLTDSQKVITGSILDLFSGRPSLRKLSLWSDNATFVDPLSVSEGRKQYSAQWYGLKDTFSDIQQLSCTVVSDGNPIEIEMKNKYTVKGIGGEETIKSKVGIYTEGEGEGMRVEKVEDKWSGRVPDGAFAGALRNLDGGAVPMAVSVPKSIEEEEGGR